ncbi:MAG: hypothetical protein H6828_15090 [Planctomycetes bacterium]|nr:hypothetical protein [Planctomycetota bacterium]
MSPRLLILVCASLLVGARVVPRDTDVAQVEVAVAPAAAEVLAHAGLVARARVVGVETRAQVPPLASERRWPSADVRLLEVALDETLYGRAPGERVVVVAPPADVAGQVAFAAGDACLLVLRPEHEVARWASADTRRELAAVAGELPLYEALEALPLVRDEAAGTFTCALPWPLGDARAGAALDYDAAKQQLVAALRALAPELRCRLVTTGPRPWSLRVAPDGEWFEDGERGGRLGASDAADLWLAAGACTASDWPAQVSASPGPDTAWLQLELRTATAVYATRVHPPPAGGYAAADRALVTSLRELWPLLPGATPELRWFLRER